MFCIQKIFCSFVYGDDIECIVLDSVVVDMMLYISVAVWFPTNYRAKGFTEIEQALYIYEYAE